MNNKLGNIVSVLILLIPLSNVFGQTENYSIKGHSFKFVQKNAESEDAINVILYRDNQELLSHTIYKEEGDCSSIHVEIGKYFIDDDKIIFYSYWAGTDRQPMPIFPYGFRKQTYEIQDNGHLILTNSQIYIEDYVENKNEDWKYFESKGSWYHKGIDFLNKQPKTSFEKDALSDYTERIERYYQAELVLGNEAQLLEQEVREKLKNEIQIATNEWIEGEVYGKVKK